MKKLTLFASILFILTTALITVAAEPPQRVVGHNSVFNGGNAEFNKSGLDTIVLIGPWGSNAQANGQFEDTSGGPAWNGWISKDLTQVTESHWYASGYAASNLPHGAGNIAAFCGDETYASCDLQDPAGGYGNNWDDILEFSYTVADAADGCTMQVSGVFNSNTEPGYDHLTFQFVTADATVTAEVFDGIHQAQNFNYSHNYIPGDYVGLNYDEVCFQIRVTSDGGWSDEDCDYWSDGACQVDDLRVQCTNGDFDDFTDFQDGTLGSWYLVFPRCVGDFAEIWVGLNDTDPCNFNHSPQVAFIDDGTQVPGVGPSYCQDWCYGPGGYIVNTTGGADPDGKLQNVIESPVVAWPEDGYQGGELVYGVYRHEDLSADAPGIFYTWHIRSTSDEINSPIADAVWKNRNFVYYGGPDYIRPSEIITDLLEPGTTHVQVQFFCGELYGWWGWDGDDGYPAPYYDNVRLNAFKAYGPGMSTRDVDLAQDNFTASGAEIDLENLAANSVRFDSALSKAASNEEHNVPGDSITCDIVSVRAGGELVSTRLVYAMYRNPIFDSVRSPLWAETGFTDGIQQGTTDTYYFDLPDSGFLFPGDVLHYYFEATDEVGQADPQTSTIPEILTGFGDFGDPTAYEIDFQFRALPSIKSDGCQPAILLWDDSAQSGGDHEWVASLESLLLRIGHDYDLYYTHGPTSGVGNGLGGRAVYDQIKGYTDLVYTSGNLERYTLCAGNDYSDASLDVQLLTQWFADGTGRDALLCGDELANDLMTSGDLGRAFVDDIMNVEVVSDNLRPFINNQVAPIVSRVAGNSVFYGVDYWAVYGGCPKINTFDAVTAGEGAERLARFTNPSGNPDYQYSAATLNTPSNDRIVTLPYDLMYIHTVPGHEPGYGVSMRTYMIKTILSYFHIPFPPIHVPAEDIVTKKFQASNHPNPFNPSTEIQYTLPKAGHLSLKIYNVRGELVKTLIDENRPMGEGRILWDGTNSQGGKVSSGVYFYEARTGGEVKVSKMALVK